MKVTIKVLEDIQFTDPVTKKPSELWIKGKVISDVKYVISADLFIANINEQYYCIRPDQIKVIG